VNHGASLAVQRLTSPLQPGEILLALLLVALAPFFFVSGPAWLFGHTTGAFANLAHVIFFALLTLLIHRRIDLTRSRRWLVVTGAVAVASVVVELIQSQLGRTPSVHDGLRNLTGVWLVIFWLRRPATSVWLARFLATALLFVEFALVATRIAEQQRMFDQLPLLSGMEASWEVERWQAVASELGQSGEFASEGEFSLQVQLSTLPYSGIALRSLPNDWSRFGQLSFDIYNPHSDCLQITVRINDVHHERGDHPWRHADRFNQRLFVEPGWNTFEFPLREVREAPNDRSMDMELIKELRLFAAGLEEPKDIYVDNFRFN
jgi:VanZ family protein